MLDMPHYTSEPTSKPVQPQAFDSTPARTVPRPIDPMRRLIAVTQKDVCGRLRQNNEIEQIQIKVREIERSRLFPF
jgi:hypothetical protein